MVFLWFSYGFPMVFVGQSQLPWSHCEPRLLRQGFGHQTHLFGFFQLLLLQAQLLTNHDTNGARILGKHVRKMVGKCSERWENVRKCGTNVGKRSESVGKNVGKCLGKCWKNVETCSENVQEIKMDGKFWDKTKSIRKIVRKTFGDSGWKKWGGRNGEKMVGICVFITDTCWEFLMIWDGWSPKIVRKHHTWRKLVGKFQVILPKGTGVPGSHPNIVLGMLGRMELRTPSIPKSHPKSFGQGKRNTNVNRMNS